MTNRAFIAIVSDEGASGLHLTFTNNNSDRVFDLLASTYTNLSAYKALAAISYLKEVLTTNDIASCAAANDDIEVGETLDEVLGTVIPEERFIYVHNSSNHTSDLNDMTIGETEYERQLRGGRWTEFVHEDEMFGRRLEGTDRTA